MPLKPKNFYHRYKNLLDEIENNRHKIFHLAKILGTRVPQAESLILKAKDASIAYEYARDIIKGRWPQAEPFIAKSPSNAYFYVVSVLKHRWPEAENTIKLIPEYWRHYKKMFDIK